MPEHTFYLWDLANTLFPETWDAAKSGHASYDDYIASLGFDLKSISAHDYEWSYKRPYREGLYDLSVADGFRDVLSWTKHNGVFTTGNKEQIDWRAEQIQRKYGFDIRNYLKEIYSTFDYGNTNKKTLAMLKDILKKKVGHGFTTVVYTDDRPANCDFFLAAVQSLQKEGSKLKARVYQLRNDSGAVKACTRDYLEIGSLHHLMDNELYLQSN